MSNQQNNELYKLIKFFEFINQDLEVYNHLKVLNTKEDIQLFLELLYEVRALLIQKQPHIALNSLINKYPNGLSYYAIILRNLILHYKNNPDLDYEDTLDNKSLIVSHEESVPVSNIDDDKYQNILVKLDAISNYSQALVELANKQELVSSPSVSEHDFNTQIQEFSKHFEEIKSNVSNIHNTMLEMQITAKNNKQELDSSSPVTMHDLNVQVNEIFKLFDGLRSNLLSVHNNMLETKKIAKESIEQVEIHFRNYSEAFTATVQNIPRFVEESQVNLFKNKLSVDIEEMTTAVNAFISKYDKLMVNTDLKVQQNIDKTAKLVNNSVDLQREKIIGYYATATKRFLILVTGISIIAAAGIGFTSAKYIEHSFINVLSDVAASAKNKK